MAGNDGPIAVDTMRSRSVSRSVLRYGNSGVLWLVNARNLASALREETSAQARPAWCVPTPVGVLAQIVNGEGLCRVVVTPHVVAETRGAARRSTPVL